jgi:ABC-type iron transport system FetAB permease component
VLKALFPGELELGLAQAAIAAFAEPLVVVAGGRRGLEKELMIAMGRGLVQIVAVVSILLLLLHSPDWTGVMLLLSMIVAAGATSARRAKGDAASLPRLHVFHRLQLRADAVSSCDGIRITQTSVGLEKPTRSTVASRSVRLGI